MNVGLENEHVDYILRKFLDNLILEEKLANTNALVKAKEESLAEMSKKLWSPPGPAMVKGEKLYLDTSTKPHRIKSFKPLTKRQAIANLNKTRKLLGIKKRDKNGRFISNKRKRRT